MLFLSLTRWRVKKAFPEVGPRNASLPDGRKKILQKCRNVLERGVCGTEKHFKLIRRKKKEFLDRTQC